VSYQQNDTLIKKICNKIATMNALDPPKKSMHYLQKKTKKKRKKERKRAYQGDIRQVLRVRASTSWLNLGPMLA
jgi:hypothetical protein